MDVDSAALDVNAWTPNDDVTNLVPIVVVASLVSIALATVFLCLSGRKSAVTPYRPLPLAPSRRHTVMLSIGAVFVLTVSFPTVIFALVIIIIEGLIVVWVTL